MAVRQCYQYMSDVWCESCTKAIKRRLEAAGKVPANPADETTYDSRDYPKGPYARELADAPLHCASGKSCRAGLVLVGGYRYGAWLGNQLTADGLRYVRQQAVEKMSPLVQFWIDKYSVEIQAEEEFDRATPAEGDLISGNGVDWFRDGIPVMSTRNPLDLKTFMSRLDGRPTAWIAPPNGRPRKHKIE